MKKIFVINGSASENSSNQRLIHNLTQLTRGFFISKLFKGLKALPHFNPELSIENTPKVVLEFRQDIERADGVLICTPEYVFSIPAGLKNIIEWCVSTTFFSDKPVGIITASASSEKGHEELQLMMKTLMAKFTNDTTLLIQGVKGRISEFGQITDSKMNAALIEFVKAFKALVTNKYVQFS